jgi:hypothetical protein
MTATEGEMILREVDKLGTQIIKSIDGMNSTLKEHNGRLRKVEEAHAFLQGAKDALGWRIPLMISIVSGIVVGTSMIAIKLMTG